LRAHPTSAEAAHDLALSRKDAREACWAAVREVRQRLGRTGEIKYFADRLSLWQSRDWLAKEKKAEKSHLKKLHSWPINLVRKIVITAVTAPPLLYSGWLEGWLKGRVPLRLVNFFAKTHLPEAEPGVWWTPTSLLVAGVGAYVLFAGLDYLELLAYHRALLKLTLSATYFVFAFVFAFGSLLILPWELERTPPGVVAFIAVTTVTLLAVGILAGTVFVRSRRSKDPQLREALNKASSIMRKPFWLLATAALALAVPLLCLEFISFVLGSVTRLDPWTFLHVLRDVAANDDTFLRPHSHHDILDMFVQLQWPSWFQEYTWLFVGSCMAAMAPVIAVKYIHNRRRANDVMVQVERLDKKTFWINEAWPGYWQSRFSSLEEAVEEAAATLMLRCGYAALVCVLGSLLLFVLMFILIPDYQTSSYMIQMVRWLLVALIIVTQATVALRRVWREYRWLVILAILGVAYVGYCNWTWWIPLMIGPGVGLLNLLEKQFGYDSEDLTYDVIVPFDDDLRITSDVIDAILISGLFSGMFYAEYLFIQWLSTYALLGHTP
jgi:hypothetical protein